MSIYLEDLEGVLYLEAAMVTFTTMTRFVDEERTNAVFLRRWAIIRDIIQICHSMDSLGTIGTLLGTLLGHYFLSGIGSNIITQSW